MKLTLTALLALTVFGCSFSVEEPPIAEQSQHQHLRPLHFQSFVLTNLHHLSHRGGWNTRTPPEPRGDPS